MSNIVYFSDYILEKSSEKDEPVVDSKNIQLSLFPEPTHSSGSDSYYVLDIKNVTERSFCDYLKSTRPTVVCETRIVPNFYLGNLSRNKFFEILKDLGIRYIYADSLANFKKNLVCYLVDDDTISVDGLNRRISELQDERLSN